MTNNKCSRCGLVNKLTEVECARCFASLRTGTPRKAERIEPQPVSIEGGLSPLRILLMLLAVFGAGYGIYNYTAIEPPPPPTAAKAKYQPPSWDPSGKTTAERIDMIKEERFKEMIRKSQEFPHETAPPSGSQVPYVRVQK